MNTYLLFKCYVCRDKNILQLLLPVRELFIRRKLIDERDRAQQEGKEVFLVIHFLTTQQNIIQF